MNRFLPSGLPIVAKAVILIGALGIMSTVANWFGLRSLQEIDRVNDTITQKIEPQRLTLTEAKIALGWIGLATYKMAASSEADTVHEANDERAGELAAAKTWLNNVAGYLPDHRDDVEGMLRRLELVNTIADSVYATRKAGERAQAQFALEFKFEPALVDAQTSMNRLIDILGGQNKGVLEAAAESKARTYKLIGGVLVGATLVTVLLAMLLAHRLVARPLQRLADCSRKIAEGHFDSPIEGLRRGD